MTSPKKFALVIKVDEEEAEEKGAAQIFEKTDNASLHGADMLPRAPPTRERGGANRLPMTGRQIRLFLFLQILLPSKYHNSFHQVIWDRLF